MVDTLIIDGYIGYHNQVVSKLRFPIPMLRIQSFMFKVTEKKKDKKMEESTWTGTYLFLLYTGLIPRFIYLTQHYGRIIHTLILAQNLHEAFNRVFGIILLAYF